MRRVQSSIHSVCAGAGATVVLHPASSGAESSLFGRRHRSSLVFTPCPPETPTRSTCFMKMQRASSTCSATGCDCSTALAAFVGEDNVALTSEAAFAANKIARQQGFAASCSSVPNDDEIENQQRWGADSKARVDESVSCFVASPFSPARGAARSSPEFATSSSPPSPATLFASRSCTLACNLPADTVACATPRAAGGDSWLAPELALTQLPLSPRGGNGATLRQWAHPDARGAATGTPLGLRRTKRIWRGMDMLDE